MADCVQPGSTDVPVPELSDGAVRLRARKLDDVDAMVQMCRDPESVRWTTVPSPYSRADAQRFVTEISPAGWRDKSVHGWAIEAADGTTEGPPGRSLRFAGNIDVRTDPRPDIGFMLHPWARGRGVMTRAVRLATRWCFDIVGMPVIHWETHKGNLASWRVAWACGFGFHGEVPAYSPQRGELRDAWLASLHPGDDGTPRTTWWEVPVLGGERVRLRPHTGDDLSRIAEACGDPGTRRWLPTMPSPYTVDNARAFVTGCRLQESLGQKVTWAVADRDSDTMLANVGLFGLEDPMCPGSAEIGYWAHPDARSRGVVREAVELVLAHAFAPRVDGGLGRHRVQLGSSWTNAASRRVADRAGFTQVGHFRLDGVVGATEEERIIEDGAWYDLLATDRA